jgi:hypothetical protein
MNCIKEFGSSQKGSIVIEAVLIIPLIILSIVAIIYIALLLYSHAYIEGTANWAAERGAAMWNNKNKHFETGKIEVHELNANGLYWRLSDNSANEKIENIISYTQKKDNKSNLLTGSNEEIAVDFKDYIIYKKIVANTQAEYTLPLGNLLEIFGMSKYYTIRAQAQASVDDSTEFVRNIDFILNLKKQLENAYPEIGNVGEKTRGVLDGIIDVIARYFK